MKAQKARKLTLSKVTVADLAMTQMNEVKGGVLPITLKTCSPTICDTCNTNWSCENTCLNCSRPC